MPKWAVYYIPQADEPFYRLGTYLLGYDVRARQEVALPNEFAPVLTSERDAWTTISRPYGFHLTICDAFDGHWTTIPRVEQELGELLCCFDGGQPFTLERLEEQPIGIWGDAGRWSLVLRYRPNLALHLLHTLLVARLAPLGIGSGFLQRYLTNPQQPRAPHEIQQLRLFASAANFGNWRPHFTLLNPYTGEKVDTIASWLNQLFQPYGQMTVNTICLLIQEQEQTPWQIYREFAR